MKGGVARILVALATALTLAVNGMAGAAGLNGITTGEVARQLDLPFTPAGYVFSIWSLIYAGLLAFSVAQLAGRGAWSPRAAVVRPVYVFAATANVAWLWFWHHEAILAALAVMLLLCGSLAAIYRYLASTEPSSAAEAWWLDRPFRLYFAWITIATLANLAVALGSGAVPGTDPDPLLVSRLLVGATLAVAGIAWWRLRDPVFLVVFAWALSGIALKGGQPASISVPAMLGCALAGLAAIDLLAGPPRAVSIQSRTG